MNALYLRIGLAFLIVAPLSLGRLAQSGFGQSSSITVVSDDIQKDQTWSGIILVAQHVTVASGATLTIQPGTTVRFSPMRPFFVTDPTLYVSGRLIAIGTADKPIRFTSDAVQPEPGDWGGIYFARGSAGSIIDHSIIEFAHTPVYPNDSITFSNSIIRWALGTGMPIYADATVTGNRIYQIGANAIEVHYQTRPAITYNTISGATYAGIQVLESSHPTIAHNIISDNSSALDISALASVDVQYNLIKGNSVGVNISNNGDAVSSVVQHNNIQDNSYLNVSMQGPQILDATRNWWGTADAAAIAARMSIDSAGGILYQPYENQPVDIGSIVYDWNNTETYDFESVDLNKYLYFESDSTREIAGLIRHDPTSGGSAGIAWDGQYIWSIIGGTFIHKLDATGKSVGSFPSPGVEPMGLAFDGQNLWVVDYTQRLVYEVDRAGNVLRSIPAPCQEPQGLAFDGQYLWTFTNQIHGKAFQFDRSGTVVRTLDTPGYLGLAWDGKYLWVNGGPDVFAQIDPSNGHTIRQITSSGAASRYMTWQEPYLWTVEMGVEAANQGSHTWLVKMLPSKETITLDGLRDDWQGRTPLVQDPKGDNIGVATDIKSVYGFMDTGNLYLMLDFYQFSGYDYASFEIDVNGDGIPDYSLGGFFPGEPRGMVLHDYSSGQDTSISGGVDYFGTELHSNAKEVAEFKIPLWIFGNKSSLGVKCYLSSLGTGVIDQTDWAYIEGSRVALDLGMNPGGAATYGTAASQGATQVGYATIANNAGPVPYGTAVFSLKQNGVTVSEAGVPASPPTTAARIFIDNQSNVLAIPGRSDSGTIDINTGIALVNYGSATANVIYTLRSSAGVTLSIGHGSLAAGGHIACFIDQLRDKAAPDFNLPSDFQDAIRFGSLDITSDQPVSVLALRGTNNQRHEFLMTTTPIADLTQPVSASPLYFPQFADGGGYTTSLILLNTSTNVEGGTLQFFDDNGVPLVVNQVGGVTNSSFTYSIPPGGSYRFQTDGSSTNVKTGWVRLTPASSNSAPVASGIFGLNPTNVLIVESGIPSAESTTHARIYVDLRGGHNTGLAIANTADKSSNIRIVAFESNGITSVGSGADSLQVPGNGHVAKFADQFISGLPAGFTGVLDISSSTPFAALTLRSLYNERNDFLMTTFPIADANQSAPSPIVFPQIVDGGGGATEFILLSSAESYWPSKTTLSFHSETGAPLAVGR